MRFAPFLAAVLLTISGCAADETSTDTSSTEDDLTTTATGVSVEQSDNKATVILQPGKKLVVNLTYGGFVANTFGAWAATPVDAHLKKGTTKTIAPKNPDAPITQRFQYQLLDTAPTGAVYPVTFTSKAVDGTTRTFKVKVKVAAHSTGAAEGKLCGGIAGIQCADGLDCVYQEAFPDASGTCRQRLVGGNVGDICGGFAGLRCADGLTCVLPSHIPDIAGTCQK
jgi:hypothetical protein